ncbi:MAG: hypothetical protein J7L62_05980 [Candidatus Aminicenantes bacterium]|nr:hypothetical protein [Candidatus Aminicenantes bacterium]
MEKIEPDFNPFADLSVTMVGVFFVILSLLLLTISLKREKERAVKTEYLPIYVGKKDLEGRTNVFFTAMGGEIPSLQDLKKIAEGAPLEMKNFLIRYSFETTGDINCTGFFPELKKNPVPAERDNRKLLAIVRKQSGEKPHALWKVSIFILDRKAVDQAAGFMKLALEDDYRVSIIFHQPGWYYIYSCALGTSIPIFEF